MDALKKEIQLIKNDIDDAWQKLSLDEIQEKVAALKEKVASPTYWSDTGQEKAQAESKQLAKFNDLYDPWFELRNSVVELEEFAAEDDDSLVAELTEKLREATNKLDELREHLKFAGKHDNSNVIMNIQAGAGGLDAQDWAGMLRRMYVRWADDSGLDISTLAESLGDEGGVKSVSLTISGKQVYGKLKGEHGVHRLVRLSPFNSASSRETSFAMVEVIPEVDEPEEIQIDETDLKIDVFRAGGHGGTVCKHH